MEREWRKKKEEEKCPIADFSSRKMSRRMPVSTLVSILVSTLVSTLVSFAGVENFAIERREGERERKRKKETVETET